MDASASILRPLSPYGPDRRGLPSFPRMSALRCCSSSVRRGIMCCGIGGQGAWQPSLRSGRLRRPASKEQDNSRRRTPCPQCRDVTSWANSSLLVDTPDWFVSACSGGQPRRPLRSRHFPLLMERAQNLVTGSLIQQARPCPVNRGGLSASIPAAFQSSVSSHDGCSGLHTISAMVGTFLLPALSHSARQTAPGTTRHRSACPLLLVDSCAVHVSTDTKKWAADQSNDQSAARLCLS